MNVIQHFFEGKGEAFSTGAISGAHNYTGTLKSFPQCYITFRPLEKCLITEAALYGNIFHWNMNEQMNKQMGIVIATQI